MKRTTGKHGQKEHKVTRTFRFHKELLIKLQATSEKSGVTKTKIIERALNHWFSLKEAA